MIPGVSMYRAILAASLAVVAATGSVLAQASPFEVRYDPAIPDARAAFGYEFGEEITPPQDAIDYLYTLEAAAPDRVEVVEYARSWEGRPLVYAVIGSAENMPSSRHPRCWRAPTKFAPDWPAWLIRAVSMLPAGPA